MSDLARWPADLDWDPVADETGLPAYAVRSAEEIELHAAVASGDAARIAAIKGLIAWRHAQFEAKPVPDTSAWFSEFGDMLVLRADEPITEALCGVPLAEQWRLRSEREAVERRLQAEFLEREAKRQAEAAAKRGE